MLQLMFDYKSSKKYNLTESISKKWVKYYDIKKNTIDNLLRYIIAYAGINLIVILKVERMIWKYMLKNTMITINIRYKTQDKAIKVGNLL